MTYPSTFTAFVYPQTTQTLNSPSHSGLHTTEASAIGQLETVIGRSGDSSVLGTVITDLRSPGSFGGGHVQTEAYGGTGKTSYIKGDILVATSASVLSKLAAGADGQVLTSNSSVASGVQWVSGNNKVYVRASWVAAVSSNETSVYSVSLPSSVLGSSASPNAVRATALIPQWATRSGSGPATFAVQYGGQTVGSVAILPIGADANAVGRTVHTIISSTPTLQTHYFEVYGSISPQTASRDNISIPTNTVQSSVYAFSAVSSCISSVDSGAPQTLGMTATVGSNNGVFFSGIIIEKIN